jgi:hypothetical protein
MPLCLAGHPYPVGIHEHEGDLSLMGASGLWDPELVYDRVSLPGDV